MFVGLPLLIVAVIDENLLTELTGSDLAKDRTEHCFGHFLRFICARFSNTTAMAFLTDR